MRELDVDVFVWIVVTTFFAIINTTDDKHLRREYICNLKKAKWKCLIQKRKPGASLARRR
ncbi:hypothetical protein YC2023_067336 [Brassica napus]